MCHQFRNRPEEEGNPYCNRLCSDTSFVLWVNKWAQWLKWKICLVCLSQKSLWYLVQSTVQLFHWGVFLGFINYFSEAECASSYDIFQLCWHCKLNQTFQIKFCDKSWRRARGHGLTLLFALTETESSQPDAISTLGNIFHWLEVHRVTAPLENLVLTCWLGKKHKKINQT